MVQPLTVRDVIQSLLQYDMDKPVYVGLGPDVEPVGSSCVVAAKEFSRTRGVPAGIYIIAFHALIKGD